MGTQTSKTLLEMKKSHEKISMLTAYDYTTAKLIDEARVDTVLVGDSLGMTMLGYDTTLPVTLDEMIVFGKSVVRACKNAFVIIDMPFMSYQVSAAQAKESAGRIIKETGAQCVKLEGGAAVCAQIKAIVDCGIPVCAHIGMTPQSVNMFGGFLVQGKDELQAQRILEDALAVQAAGAFMVVLECIPPRLAALITKKVDMITIGIGAGKDCDGQVLVYQDMLGMTQGVAPKFVKDYANLAEIMKGAFKTYADEVKASVFPDTQHSFVKSDCSEEFLATLDTKYKTMKVLTGE